MLKLSKLNRRIVPAAWAFLLLLLLAGAAAAQPSEGADPEPFVLEPLLLPPPGTEAVYYIEEFFSQLVLEQDGFFLLAPPDSMEEMSLAAVVAHYTVLEPDPEDGRPRVLVRAVAFDPEYGDLLYWLGWQATYAFTENGAVWAGGDPVPAEYEDVVNPDWLADWSLLAPQDAPYGPVRAGDQWEGAAHLDIEELADMFSEVDVSASGRFLGPVGEPDGAENAVGVTETMRGRAAGLMELGEGLYAQVDFDVEGEQLYVLVPGSLPHGMTGLVTGVMEFVVGPESGAPAGVEGVVAMSMYYDLYVEQVDAGLFPWWAFDESGGEQEFNGLIGDLAFREFALLTEGRPAAGVLGAWSDELTDGTYADFYEFVGEAGRRVFIEMRSSDLDAYLFLLDRDGNVLAADDDGAGGVDARIDYTLPYSGSYVVIANTFFPGESGLYTLELTWGEPPGVDFERAVELIELLASGRTVHPGELDELERLLEQLLEHIRSRR